MRARPMTGVVGRDRRAELGLRGVARGRASGGTSGVTASPSSPTRARADLSGHRLAALAADRGPAPPASGGATAFGGRIGRRANFVSTALAQQGKPYVWGANAAPSDPNPKAFDCSELTKWAAARVGVDHPRRRAARSTSTLQRPRRDDDGRPGAAHAGRVAVPLRPRAHATSATTRPPSTSRSALGDGVHTIEARGHAYGTNVFDNAGGRDFNFAGMIPGMS